MVVVRGCKEAAHSLAATPCFPFSVRFPTRVGARRWGVTIDKAQTQEVYPVMWETSFQGLVSFLCLTSSICVLHGVVPCVAADWTRHRGRIQGSGSTDGLVGGR